MHFAQTAERILCLVGARVGQRLGTALDRRQDAPDPAGGEPQQEAGGQPKAVPAIIMRSSERSACTWSAASCEDFGNRALDENSARATRTGPEKTYQTYTRYNPRTNQCYTGMTSGYGTPEQNVRKRNANQSHLNSEGFEKGIVDQSSSNYLAIRGREQQVMEVNGGGGFESPSLRQGQKTV